MKIFIFNNNPYIKEKKISCNQDHKINIKIKCKIIQQLQINQNNKQEKQEKIPYNKKMKIIFQKT